MMLIALASVQVVSGCGGPGHTRQLDASVDGGATDGAFVDVAPTDGALPCSDQQVSRVPIAGDVGPVQDGSEARISAVAAEGDELVLAWEAPSDLGYLPETRLARIRDPLAPVLERVAPALPIFERAEMGGFVERPDGLGIFVQYDTEDEVKHWAWTVLGRDGSFSPVSELELSAETGAVCAGDPDVSAAAFTVSGFRGWLGLAVVVMEDHRPTYLEPAYSVDLLGTERQRLAGCTVQGDVVTAVTQRQTFTSIGCGEPVAFQWSLGDGELVRAPFEVGDLPAVPMVTVLAGDTLVLAFGLDPAPTAWAFRLADGAAELLAQTELGGGLDDVDPPYPMGAMPSEAGGLNVLYNHNDVLYLLPFSPASGFGARALLTDAGCRSNSRNLVTLPSATFLPCSVWDRLFLLTMCRGRGGER